VRDRGNSGLFYYAFIGDDQTAEFPGGHVVGFPGNLANCTKCQTVRVWPAEMMLLAMPVPMMPRPTNPSLSMPPR
jgi:hypothetical protein